MMELAALAAQLMMELEALLDELVFIELFVCDEFDIKDAFVDIKVD